LRRNCLLKHVTEGKRKGRMKVIRRRGRRCKLLLDDLTKKAGYLKLKEEPLDSTVWRTLFVRGYGLVVRRNEITTDNITPNFVIAATVAIKVITCLALVTEYIKKPNSQGVHNSVTSTSVLSCIFLHCRVPISTTPQDFARHSAENYHNGVACNSTTFTVSAVRNAEPP
jgi:hypothetical protein